MKHSYIDKYWDLQSPIHRIDPRVKIIICMGFILFVIFTAPTSLGAFASYSLLLAILIGFSKVPFRFILMRSLVIVPFVLMIAVFIPFVKKGQVAGAYSLGSLKLTVTYDGLMIFWNVLIKAFLSIVAVTLLMSTTKFTQFLKALERFKIPQVFTMILSFMYRYFFVITDEFAIMLRAKEARSVGGSGWFHIRTLSNMLGVLFLKSYEKGEVVYLAMCARGYHGNIKTIDEMYIKKSDVALFIVMFSVLGYIRFLIA